MCASARSVGLSLWPTGGRLMPLSEADMLPLHFFFCPIGLTLSYFLSSSFFSPFSLCFHLVSLFFHLHFSQTNTFVPHPSRTAVRHTIGIEIARGRGCCVKRLGFKPVTVISMSEKRGRFFFSFPFKNDAQLGVNMLHMAHCYCCCCCSATILWPGTGRLHPLLYLSWLGADI